MQKTIPFVLVCGLLFSCDGIRYVQFHVAQQSTEYKTSENGASTEEGKASIKEGGKVKVLVDAYNPLSQTVSINQVQGSYFYNTPSPLLTAFFPDLNSSQSTTTTTTSNLTPQRPPVKRPGVQNGCPGDSLSLLEAVQKFEDYNNDVSKYYRGYKAFYNNLLQVQTEYYELSLQPSLDKKTVRCLLMNWTNNLSGALSGIEPSGPGGVRPTTASSLTQATGYDTSLFSSTGLLNYEIAFRQYFSDAADSLQNLQNKLNDILKKIGDKNYDVYLQHVSASCASYDKLGNQLFIAELSASLGFYQDLNKKITAEIDAGITAVIKQYAQLLHLSFNTIQANIPVENTDEFKTTITVTNTSGGGSQTYTLSLPVTHIVKIDFSAGAFYAPLLYNEIAKITKVPGHDSITVQSIKTSDFTVGPMGYVNFHSQWTQGFNLGAYLSAGLAFNQSAKLVVGGGFAVLIGKYQRFVLHGGISFAQVDRVSSIYPEGAQISDVSYTPSTVQVWKSSGMLGLSWNLTR